MFTSMRTCSLFPAFLLALVAQAQPASGALNELNVLYDGAVRFRVDREDRLVVDLFDAGGHIRQDVVYVEFLDPGGIRYSAEEAAVVMACADGHANCISKEVFKMNVVRHTGRSVFPLAAGDAEGARAIALLSAAIVEARQALEREASETHARPQRKK
ncbi:MAG: hypothetical protein GFGODING_01489 [Flavobacteriales bacterium]|nr:hypothetical protein [Flavobacteriales bacterium]